MTSLAPLHTLLEQATIARDSALADQQRARQAAQAAAAQAEQLSDYRREYARRFGVGAGQAGAIELMQCYQGFMARLDSAVSQQAQIAAQAQTRFDAAQAALLLAEQRVASVRKLIDKRSAEIAQSQARSEQKASDEFASRAAWNKRQGGALAAAFGNA